MKSKIKAAILFLVVFFSINIMLAGCTNTQGNDIDNITIKTDNLEPVTLTFYMAGEEKKDTKEVLDKVATATNLNIKLDFKWFSIDKYFDCVKAAFASKEDFDAFLCGKFEQGANNIIDMFRNGQIKDISELLPKYAPAICSQLSQEELDIAKVDGKLVYVPSMFPSVSVLGVYVRDDIADKYSITAINTLEDYEELLKKIKENEKNILPGFITGNNKYNISFYANAYGYIVLDYSQNLVYKWNDPEMKIIPWEQTAGFKETAGFISRWFTNGYMEISSQQKETASFISRTGNLYEGPIKLDLFNDGNMETYTLNILYKNEKTQRISSFNDSTIGVAAFNSSSKNTERALAFLNWIQDSQENYDLFNFGIENRHYLLKDNRIDMPEGISISDNPYWWHELTNNLLNAAFMNIRYHRQSVNDTQPYNYYKDYMKYTQSHTSYAPHEGFCPDYLNIQADCTKRMQIYSSRISDAFQRGKYNTDQTDIIIEELKNAGAEQIVDEIQRQLDQWRSVNKK